MMVPVAAGVLLYGAYKVLEGRTRIQEQETQEKVAHPGAKVVTQRRPKDVFSHYLDPATAVWDVNTEEYSFTILNEGQTYDGNVRQDIKSGHGRAPVSGIY